MIKISEEIKAKITIEADTSGADEAAAALEKLQGMAGDGSIGDSLAKQFATGGEEAKNLTEALGGSEEALKANEEAASDATTAMEDHQQAIEDTASAYEDLQEPVENVNKGLASVQETLTKSTPVFSQAAEHMSAFQDAMANPEPFNTVRDYLDQTGQSWGDFIDAVGPENANRLVNVQNNLDGISNGFTEVNKSAGTFTDAFTSTQAAMDEFNQTDPWANFNVGVQGASKAVEQVDTAINKFGGIGSSQYGPLTFADTLSAKWKMSASDAATAVEQMGGAEGSLGKIFGGAGMEIGNAFMGLSSWVMPLMAFQMVGTMVAQVGQSIYDSAAIAEGPAAHSMGTFTGSVDALGQSAQRAGETFSESFGRQLIPTLDAMNYEMNQGGGAGEIGGTLGGAASFLTNTGLILGGLLSPGTPWGWSMLKAGGEGMINQGADWLGLQEPFQGPGPQAQAQINYQRSFANLPQTVGVSATNLQLQGDTAMQDALDPNYLAQQQYASSAQQYLQRQQASYNASHPAPSPQQMALNYQDKQYTAQDEQAYQNYLTNPPTYGQDIGAEIQQGNWGGVWHSLMQAAGFAPPSGPTGSGGMGLGSLSPFGSFLGGGSGPMTSVAQQMGLPSLGSIFSGLSGGLTGFGDVLGNLGKGAASFFGFGGGEGMGAGGSFADSGGCFVAGTRVLLADGTERPIEQLQVGEHVLGYDGKKTIPVMVQACITFPRKQTYELTFSDGRTLTLTDSHPLYSPDAGWRSLSPAMTKEESSDLPVSQLEIGDVIAVIDGTCTLIALEKKQVEQVYNISVDGSHTYYANGILVHNKGASFGGGGAQNIGSQIADQIGSIQLPHIDLGGIAAGLGGAFSGIQLPHLDLGGISGALGGAFSGLQLPHLDLGGIAAGLGSAFSGIQLPHLDLGGIASSLGGAFSGITLPHIPDIGGMINGALGGMFSGITLPSIPDIGGMINGALGGMFSGITLPSIPDIGGMINGALGGVFSGITLPSIPNIGGMINGALGGIFGGITIPSVPDIGGMLNGALGGIFGNIQLPNIPDIGGMINGALGGMFSGIQMPSIPNIAGMINGALSSMFSGIMIPAFASGVEGFGGGLAVVGEAGPELVALPGGSSVYPMSTNKGGGLSPISLGGSGGSSGPHTANISVYLDSQMLISLMGASLQSSINVGLGKRSY